MNHQSSHAALAAVHLLIAALSLADAHHAHADCYALAALFYAALAWPHGGAK